MKTYKVGDTVKIRSDLVVGESYGGVRFLEKLKSLCGTNTSIRAVFISGKYRIKTSYNTFWTSEMFESVDAKISFNYLIL